MSKKTKVKVHKQELTVDFGKLPASLKLMFFCFENADKTEFYDHKIVATIDKDKIIDKLKEHFGCEAIK